MLALSEFDVLFVSVIALSVAVPAIAIIDIALKPSAAFRLAGVSRTAYVLPCALGIPLLGVGLIPGALWFFGVRSAVVEAASELEDG